MEEARGGELKNVLMAKFKEGTSESQIELLIESFANLVNLVEPMKSFHWGKELSIEKAEEGYTHVFETTFESMEGMAEYAVHPAHHDFAKLFLPNLEKMCFIAAPDQQVMTLKNPTEIQAMLMKFLSK
ncbi:stress-response A/B barrel domain-containing protein HS1-like [Pyrus communis]|uniref:stress-response A/B barrel domain-containing protein HS1-like n=1 Tax=Pyrus communis TaxID=23211 RepID=UPI0035BEF288